MREIAHQVVQRGARRPASARVAASIRLLPRAAAAPVANSSTVSLVEVSLSTVMQLKVVGAGRQQRLQRRLGDGRVGEDEAQHGRHVGRDHAGALGRSR